MLGAVCAYRRVLGPEKDCVYSKEDHGKPQPGSDVIRCWGAEHHFCCSFSTLHSVFVHHLPLTHLLCKLISFQHCTRKGLKDENDGDLPVPISPPMLTVVEDWNSHRKIFC